ncbi:unnamed protein product [Phytophthora lilii]|uniref:Unnamed protein product n=1 Tax=Phytophthora lilii TaxID=2077276 RepID=A0A9W6X3Q7_9STRA|nr:unnamed protein product [Phytophthora lilii]
MALLMLTDILETVVALHDINLVLTHITSTFATQGIIMHLLNKAGAVEAYSHATNFRTAASPKVRAGHCWQHVKITVAPDAVAVTSQVIQSLQTVNVSSSTISLLGLSSSVNLVDLAASQRALLSLSCDFSVDTARSREILQYYLRLLYMTEFILLIEFTEIMVPCIYSKLRFCTALIPGF